MLFMLKLLYINYKGTTSKHHFKGFTNIFLIWNSNRLLSISPFWEALEKI